MASKSPVRPRLGASLGLAASDARLLSDQTYTGVEFRELDLACPELVLTELSGCRLEQVRLAGVRLHRVIFSDCELVACDLANVEPHDSSLLRVRVTSSRLMGLNGVNCFFQDVTFDGCRNNLAAFRFSRFKTVVFRDCDLREASFQGAELNGVEFLGCDLTGAQFSAARMEGVRFADCLLAGIHGVESFQGATVSGHDLLDLTYSMASALGIRIEISGSEGS